MLFPRPHTLVSHLINGGGALVVGLLFAFIGLDVSSGCGQGGQCIAVTDLLPSIHIPSARLPASDSVEHILSAEVPSSSAIVLAAYWPASQEFLFSGNGNQQSGHTSLFRQKHVESTASRPRVHNLHSESVQTAKREGNRPPALSRSQQ